MKSVLTLCLLLIVVYTGFIIQMVDAKAKMRQTGVLSKASRVVGNETDTAVSNKVKSHIAQ